MAGLSSLVDHQGQPMALLSIHNALSGHSIGQWSHSPKVLAAISGWRVPIWQLWYAGNASSGTESLLLILSITAIMDVVFFLAVFLLLRLFQ